METQYKKIEIFLIDGTVLQIIADGSCIAELQAEIIRFHDDAFPGE